MANFGAHRYYRYQIVTNSGANLTSLRELIPILGSVVPMNSYYASSSLPRFLPAYLRLVSAVYQTGVDNVVINASISSSNFTIVTTDFDDLDTSWLVGGTGAWGSLEFPEPLYLPLWYLRFGSTSHIPVSSILQYSDNGSDWTTFKTIADSEFDDRNVLIAGGDYLIKKVFSFSNTLNNYKTIHKNFDFKQSLVTDRYIKFFDFKQTLNAYDKSSTIPTLGNLKWHLSGGSSNTDLSACLGGSISTEQLLNQEVIPKGTLSGVTVLTGCGNEQGFGHIYFEIKNGKKYLTWVGSGELYGGSAEVASDGIYTIMGGRGTYHGYLSVDVSVLDLPSEDAVLPVHVTNHRGNLFNPIDAATSKSGITVYRCFYLKNDHDKGIMYDLKLFSKFVTHPECSLSVGLDPSGINGEATTIVDEETEPDGVSFSQPTLESPITIGTLAYQRYIPIWVKLVFSDNNVRVQRDNLIGLSVSARFYQ